MIVHAGNDEPYAVCDGCCRRFGVGGPPAAVQIGTQGAVSALCGECMKAWQGTVEEVLKRLVEPILEAAKGL